MIKKILTATLGIGMVLGTIAPAFAGVNVGNTGPNSTLDARLNRVKNHILNLSNSYTLNQNASSTQATGGNAADYNTGNGTSAAGNTTANHTSQVEANSVNVDANLTADSASDNNVTVNITGPSSTANAIVDTTRNSTVTITNAGSVNNTFTSTTTTGGNSAGHNTGNGNAIGGDSSIWSLITTKLNSVIYKLSM